MRATILPKAIILTKSHMAAVRIMVWHPTIFILMQL